MDNKKYVYTCDCSEDTQKMTVMAGKFREVPVRFSYKYKEHVCVHCGHYPVVSKREEKKQEQNQEYAAESSIEGSLHKIMDLDGASFDEREYID